ncbi:hypothetical protein D3C77_754610 [compost metagenome]
MHFVHIEYMVRWCEDHLVAFCKYHRLKHVNDLSDICHFHTLTIFMENIQINAGN